MISKSYDDEILMQVLYFGMTYKAQVTGQGLKTKTAGAASNGDGEYGDWVVGRSWVSRAVVCHII